MKKTPKDKSEGEKRAEKSEAAKVRLMTDRVIPAEEIFHQPMMPQRRKKSDSRSKRPKKLTGPEVCAVL